MILDIRLQASAGKYICWLFPLLIIAFEGHSQTQLLNDVKELSSDTYQGRKTGTEGNRKAAGYIISRFRAIGLKGYHDAYKQEFILKDRGKKFSGTNLVGYIPGKKNDVIVISAHYDHLGILNGKIYNGADDDASGIGGLLHLAAYFAANKPEHTLIFAAFDAEEMGLKGSAYFEANAPVPLSSIRLNINMDMISHNNKGELYVCGTYHYPELKDYLLIPAPKIKLLPGHDNPKNGTKDDWTFQGDHGMFHKARIPFLYFGVEDHKDYHQPTDDFDNINKEFYANAVTTILTVVKNYDQGLTKQQLFRNKRIMK